MAAVAGDLIMDKPEGKKKGKSRKALSQKNPSQNEANIAAGAQFAVPQPSPEDSVGKENPSSEPMSQKRTKKASAKAKAKANQPSSFEKELQEMQGQLEKLKLDKEKAEEDLKAKDESLKQKEEELERRDKEQQKLKNELKKMQKLKEFRPTMTFPLGVSQDKKKGSTKKPSPPYVLWCKDNWNEVKKSNPDADFKEMSNLLSAKWKTVTPEEKKPYEEKYLAEKEAYLKVVGNEKREHEAMKLLEEEHKQKTAMELKVFEAVVKICLDKGKEWRCLLVVRRENRALCC